MTAKIITVPLELTEDEAWDFAQFLKRAGFSDYRSSAADKDETCRMLHVGQEVRGVLLEVEINPE